MSPRSPAKLGGKRKMELCSEDQLRHKESSRITLMLNAADYCIEVKG
jgi:hypothetical protein